MCDLGRAQQQQRMRAPYRAPSVNSTGEAASKMASSELTAWSWGTKSELLAGSPQFLSDGPLQEAIHNVVASF